MTIDYENEAQLRQALSGPQSEQSVLWSALGRLLRHKGNNPEAADCYRKASALPGAMAPDWFNLGNVLYDLQQYAEALEAFNTALQLEPDMPPAALQRARCLAELGQHDKAHTAYTDLLQLDDTNFNAWLELGHVSRKQGNFAHAQECYEHAVACRPQDHRGYLAAARLLEATDQQDAAALHLQSAIGLCAQHPDPVQLTQLYHRMGRYRMEDGRVPQALEALRCAQLCVSQTSDTNMRSEVDTDVAEGLMRMGLMPQAREVLVAAINNTHTEETAVRLAQTAFRFNEWQIALDALRRNVALHPTSSLAYFNLAHMLAECAMLEEATQHLDKAEALNGEPFNNAITLRAAIAGKSGDADTALQLYSDLIEREDIERIRSSAAMCSLYSCQLNPEEVAQLHRKLCEPLGQDARPRNSFANPRTWDRPLRVGVVTADFHHQHPVNIFFQPILARWDHQRFPLTTYFVGSSYDEQTQLAKSRSDVWREITHATQAQVARQIEEDGIDILFDLGGHTGQQRMAMFAQRMAPVQVTFLGYPGSTGCPNMDWLLGDPIVTPPEDDPLCSEQVWRLPNTVFCYAPEQDYPYVKPDVPDMHRPLRFASFNNTAKLTPTTIALWARVLRAIPSSELLLKAPSFGDASTQQRYADMFAQYHVPRKRLIFQGASPLAEMMQTYGSVDIALDPSPYNGGTTSLQALWMGVPVLTLRGGHFVSRMGASFMTGADLPEWVANSDDDFVSFAHRMASNRLGLLAMKHKMRERLLQLPAWNIDQYVQDFNQAMFGMWSDWCLTPPQTLSQTSALSN